MSTRTTNTLTVKKSAEITHCDVCRRPLNTKLYDSRISGGNTWANMCESCFKVLGTGLGVGLGQEYVKCPDHWLKVRG